VVGSGSGGTIGGAAADSRAPAGADDRHRGRADRHSALFPLVRDLERQGAAGRPGAGRPPGRTLRGLLAGGTGERDQQRERQAEAGGAGRGETGRDGPHAGTSGDGEGEGDTTRRSRMAGALADALPPPVSCGRSGGECWQVVDSGQRRAESIMRASACIAWAVPLAVAPCADQDLRRRREDGHGGVARVGGQPRTARRPGRRDWPRPSRVRAGSCPRRTSVACDRTCGAGRLMQLRRPGPGVGISGRIQAGRRPGGRAGRVGDRRQHADRGHQRAARTRGDQLEPRQHQPQRPLDARR